MPLTGGNTTPVVRVGATVRRGVGPWTATAQGLLAHVRARGVTQVPEPRGLDAQGREVVSYLPGEVPHDLPPAVWEPRLLDDAARLLRRLHDASVGYAPQDAAWRMPAHEPVEVICHNDVAPYNLVLDDAGRLAGLIDFDTASPGPRVWDLAYLAYRLAPLIGENGPDLTLAERLARVDRLVAAYRAAGPADDPGVAALDRAAVLRVLLDRLDELAAFTDGRAAESGDPAFRAHAALYRADRERLAALVTGR